MSKKAAPGTPGALHTPPQPRVNKAKPRCHFSADNIIQYAGGERAAPPALMESVQILGDGDTSADEPGYEASAPAGTSAFIAGVLVWWRIICRRRAAVYSSAGVQRLHP